MSVLTTNELAQVVFHEVPQVSLTNLMAQVVFYQESEGPPPEAPPEPPILACSLDDLTGTVFGTTIPGLRLGEQYEARAWAVNQFGLEGAVFGPVAFTSAGWTELPAAPATITAAQGPGKSIRVTWSEVPAVQVLHYELQRNGVTIGKIGDTEHVDQAVSYGVAYTYRVRTVDRAKNASAAWTTASPITLDANLDTPDFMAESISVSGFASSSTDVNITDTEITLLSVAVSVGSESPQQVHIHSSINYLTDMTPPTDFACVRVYRGTTMLAQYCVTVKEDQSVAIPANVGDVPASGIHTYYIKGFQSGTGTLICRDRTMTVAVLKR